MENETIEFTESYDKVQALYMITKIDCNPSVDGIEKFKKLRDFLWLDIKVQDFFNMSIVPAEKWKQYSEQ